MARTKHFIRAKFSGYKLGDISNKKVIEKM